MPKTEGTAWENSQGSSKTKGVETVKCCNCGRNMSIEEAYMIRTDSKCNADFMCMTCLHGTDTYTARLEYYLREAITLLKLCVNYDNKPMTAAICGETGDKVREFIKRCEK